MRLSVHVRKVDRRRNLRSVRWVSSGPAPPEKSPSFAVGVSLGKQQEDALKSGEGKSKDEQRGERNQEATTAVPSNPRQLVNGGERTLVEPVMTEGESAHAESAAGENSPPLPGGESLGNCSESRALNNESAPECAAHPMQAASGETTPSAEETDSENKDRRPPADGHLSEFSQAGAPSKATKVSKTSEHNKAGTAQCIPDLDTPSPAKDHAEESSVSTPRTINASGKPEPAPTSQSEEVSLPKIVSMTRPKNDSTREQSPTQSEIQTLEDCLHPDVREYIPSVLEPKNLGKVAPETRLAILSGRDALVVADMEQRSALAWASILLAADRIAQQRTSIHARMPRLARVYSAAQGITTLIINHYSDEPSNEGLGRAAQALLGPRFKKLLMFNDDVKSLVRARDANRIATRAREYKVAVLSHARLKTVLLHPPILAKFQNLEVIVVDGRLGTNLADLLQDIKALPVRPLLRQQKLVFADSVTRPVETLARGLLGEDYAIFSPPPDRLKQATADNRTASASARKSKKTKDKADRTISQGTSDKSATE